jgi:hypothetical protein
MMINDNSKSSRIMRLVAIVVSSLLALGFILSYVTQLG